jgi:Tol biopolymer transport system component
MRNLFKTTLYITAFALSGILFQISCSNSDGISQNTNQSLGKIIYFHLEQNNNNRGIWICNYDGTNATQIPIVLPTGTTFSLENGDPRPRLSPDGQRVFFNVSVNTNPTNGASIYSCNIDGSDLQPVVVSSNSSSEFLGGVY